MAPPQLLGDRRYLRRILHGSRLADQPYARGVYAAEHQLDPADRVGHQLGDHRGSGPDVPLVPLSKTKAKDVPAILQNVFILSS